jgi:hypothetical protein
MGALYAVENMELPSLGDTLRRRRGFTSLTCGGPTYAFHLWPSNKSNLKPSFMVEAASANMIGTSRGAAFGAEPTSTAAGMHFNYLGGFSSAQPVRTRVSLSSGQFGEFGAAPPTSCITTEGYVLTAAPTSGSVLINIESPSGKRIASTGVLASAVKSFALGTTIYVVYQISRDLNVVTFVPGTSSSWTAAVTISNALVNSSARWDVASDGGNKWWIAYQQGATTLEVRYYQDAVYQGNTTETLTSGDYADISVSYLPNLSATVWVGWYDDPGTTGAIKYTVYTQALADATGGSGPYTIATVVDVHGAPLFGEADYSGHDDWDGGSYPMTAAAFYVYRLVDASTVSGTKYGLASATGGPSTYIGTHPHVLPVGKPDNKNRVWCITDNGSGNEVFYRYLLLKFYVRNYALSGNVFASTVTVELASKLYPVAKSDWDLGAATTYGWFCNDNNNYDLTGSTRVFPIVAILQTSDQELTSEVHAIEYSVAENSWRHSAIPFREHCVVSGVPTEVGASPMGIALGLAGLYYSEPGFGSTEIGWALNPVITSLADTAGAPGNIAAGTYVYQVVYQSVDGRGRRHLSAPSAPVSITLAATGYVVVSMTSAAVTQRITTDTSFAMLKPSALVYRTTNGGTTYHFVGSTAAVDHSDGLVTFQDELADASIEDEEILYTDGNVLANHLAPSGRFVAKSADRIWVGGCIDSYTVYASKIIVPDEPPAFTEHGAFEVTFPEEVTGLCVMDDTVLVFSERSIFAVSGAGPNDQGTGYFDPPRRVSDGVGCIDGHSIVVTELGVLFRAQMGFKLLPRGLGAVEDLGQGVNFTIADNAFVEATGAVLENDTTHQAKFLVSTEGATSQNILTFDLLNRQWTRDVFGDGTLWYCIGAWSKGFALAGVDDEGAEIVGYQMGSAYNDCGEEFTAKIQTAWQTPFGPGGWGRVNRVLLPLVGYHYTVTCEVEVDGDSQSFTLTVPSATPVTEPYVYRECVLNQGQGTAYRVTLTSSTEPSTDAKLFGISAILFEVADSESVRLLTAAEKGE